MGAACRCLPSGRGDKLARDLDRSVASCGWVGGIPEEEAYELQALKPCQAKALLHIRKHCFRMHQRALPYLQARTEQLGFTAADLEQTLAFIREQAPVIIHVNLARDGALLASDTHYRNMFEVHSNPQGLDIHARSRMDWESELFGRAYNRDAEHFDRCKYGVLNCTNDPQGVRCCAPVYGTSYLLLKGVRLRTTLSAEDSAGLHASELATVDRYAHVLARYTDSELYATLEVGTRRSFAANSLNVAAYKEAQIHGEVRLSDHVALIMAHPSLKEFDQGVLERLSERCNAPLVWMEDQEEEEELAEEDELLRQGIEQSREEEELNRALQASQASAQEQEELNKALEASRREAAAASAAPQPRAEEKGGKSPAAGQRAPAGTAWPATEAARCSAPSSSRSGAQQDDGPSRI